MQGDYDRAKSVSHECSVHARAVGHAFNLVWSMTFSAYVFAYGREPDALLEQIGLADSLAREQGLAFFNQVSIPQATGIALLQQGRTREAITLLRRSIDSWAKVGGGVRIPYLKSSLAEALALEGQLAEAMSAIEECVEQIERLGYQERIWLPEVLRIKGWISKLQGCHLEAEDTLRAAVDLAHRQGTKSWELRSTLTLAHLLTEQGRHQAAQDALSSIYSWFPEGAHTQDLAEARALLGHLASELQAPAHPSRRAEFTHQE
jgi:tetratricopeptide (TPR) repeat protein